MQPTLNLNYGNYTLSLDNIKVVISVNYAGRTHELDFLDTNGNKIAENELPVWVVKYAHDFAQRMIASKSGRNFFEENAISAEQN